MVLLNFEQDHLFSNNGFSFHFNISFSFFHCNTLARVNRKTFRRKECVELDEMDGCLGLPTSVLYHSKD